MKTIKSGWVIYKGFRIDWSPRCEAWKIVQAGSHGHLTYMLIDFTSLDKAKKFVTKKLCQAVTRGNL